MPRRRRQLPAPMQIPPTPSHHLIFCRRRHAYRRRSPSPWRMLVAETGHHQRIDKHICYRRSRRSCPTRTESPDRSIVGRRPWSSRHRTGPGRQVSHQSLCKRDLGVRCVLRFSRMRHGVTDIVALEATLHVLKSQAA